MGKDSRTDCATLTVSVVGFIIAVSSLVLVLLIWIDPSAYPRPQTAKPTVSVTPSGSSQTASSDKKDSCPGSMVDAKADEKTYLIGVGPNWRPYEYVDNDGTMKGYTADVVHEVCRQARKTCRIIQYKYAGCWDDGNGADLQNGWFDACSGYLSTVARGHVFQFSAEYAKADASAMFVKTGSGITNTTGLKIGFQSGWFSDPICLHRNGVEVAGSDRVTAATKDELTAKVDNGEVHALFLSLSDGAALTGYEKLGSDYQCALGGPSLMMRKDTRMSWFDAALKLVKESGRLREICDGALAKHGGSSLVCV